MPYREDKPKDTKIEHAFGTNRYILPGMNRPIKEGREWLSKMQNGAKFVPEKRENVDEWLNRLEGSRPDPIVTEQSTMIKAEEVVEDGWPATANFRADSRSGWRYPR
jgi:hypothetical protein